MRKGSLYSAVAIVIYLFIAICFVSMDPYRDVAYYGGCFISTKALVESTDVEGHSEEETDEEAERDVEGPYPSMSYTSTDTSYVLSPPSVKRYGQGPEPSRVELWKELTTAIEEDEVSHAPGGGSLDLCCGKPSTGGMGANEDESGLYRIREVSIREASQRIALLIKSDH